jgi:biopolymer transport protein ExbD
MTPFLVQQQIKINLPHSSTSSEGADRPIVISMQRQGELSLNGRPVAASALETELKPLLGANNERPVVIQADRETPLEKVVAVMDVAKRLQVGKLGIAVEQPKP